MYPTKMIYIKKKVYKKVTNHTPFNIFSVVFNCILKRNKTVMNMKPQWRKTNVICVLKMGIVNFWVLYFSQ